MAEKKYTDEQKEEFFRVLDRGGTVRAAARAAGAHEKAGYNWLRKNGLTMQRATPRIYPPELKEEFLRLVRERQIISTVARELGIHRTVSARALSQLSPTVPIDGVAPISARRSP